MTRKISQVACFFVLFSLIISATAVPLSNPVPLRNAFDRGLQQKLEQTVDRLNLRQAIAQRKLAVTLVDVSDLENPRVAEINGDEMMYAASLPKIGILLAAFAEIERGKLKLNARMRKSLSDMIRYSSNIEATRVLNLVGKHKVNQILQSEPYRLYDRRLNGGIWVGKEYGKKPAFQRDPLHNISHGATAMQVARFYYLLETGQLVNAKLTAEMKEILSKPGIHHKFVKGLDGRDVSVFRKSGTWKYWHADSALVEGHNSKYIIVGLVEHPDGGTWLTKLARAIDNEMLATSTHYEF